MKYRMITCGLIGLAILSSISCSRFNEPQEPAPEKEPLISELLSAFLSTKSTQPLENTVWKAPTGETYDHFLLFREGQVKFFYGLEEEGELQKWSPFYSAPYTLEQDGIHTDLSYPYFNHTIYNNHIGLIQSQGAFTIKTQDDVYTFHSMYTEDLEYTWVLVYAPITPWGNDNTNK